MNTDLIQGQTTPAFAEVRAEFQRNFAKRGEVGAACAVYHRGDKVVDLWGGYRDRKQRLPWEQDTLVLVFSTTKGMAAMAVAVAHSQGLLDYDAPVARYWPAFAEHGKEQITVRQLLSHQAGLCALDPLLDRATLRDRERLSAHLAQQRPAWQPGSRHGYHAITIGWYAGELIRQVDARRRTLGQFFQEEIARPLGIEFYIGTPADIPESRFATIEDVRPLQMLLNLHKLPFAFVREFLNSRSLSARAFHVPGVPRASALGGPTLRGIEMPASNGIGQVRAIARAYSAFATGGHELGLKSETLEALMHPPRAPEQGSLDEVLRIETCFSLGYLKPYPGYRFGSSERAFGTPGLGGSFGFADPDAQIGFAYAPNRCGSYIWDDPRERALREAVYRCLAR